MSKNNLLGVTNIFPSHPAEAEAKTLQGQNPPSNRFFATWGWWWNWITSWNTYMAMGQNRMGTFLGMITLQKSSMLKAFGANTFFCGMNILKSIIFRGFNLSSTQLGCSSQSTRGFKRYPWPLWWLMPQRMAFFFNYYYYYYYFYYVFFFLSGDGVKNQQKPGFA